MERLPLMIPRMLEKGDRVGVISPSGPVHESELEQGLDMLKSSGYEVVLGSGVYLRHGYMAGEDGLRLADFHDMFADPEIKAVFCSRGGYGAMRLLRNIDYELVRNNPKLFIGYSDITALHMALHLRTGLVSFHGPVVRGFHENKGANFKKMIEVVSNPQPQPLSLKMGSVLAAGKAKGPLMGGNLSVICSLLGTPYLPSFKGSVFFMEDRGEQPYRVDRMLTQLLMSGKIDDISCLLLGEFRECGEDEAIADLMKERLAGLGIPVIKGLPVGHGANNLALPIGVNVEIDSSSMALSFIQKPVSNRPD